MVNLHPENFTTHHPSRQVNSIYFDTPTLECLNDNLRGVANRNKLRLRWYGDHPRHVNAQLELKRKRGMVGDKKIFNLPYKVDLTNSWSTITAQLKQHAPIEWRLIIDEAVRPTLINRYQRDYYVSRDGEMRVTLDYDQVAYDQRFGIRPNLRTKTIIPKTVIIELKSPASAQARLTNIVQGFPIRRTRNSKYTSGVLASF